MKKLLLPFLLLSASLFMAFSPQADDLLDKLMSQLAVYNQKRPQEKLYLHMDRPTYMAGDTIWAQAYLTDKQNQPRALSKLIHVQLENDKGITVKQWQLPVKKGLANASLQIPTDIKQGLYRLTAFTQWMRNVGPEAFFTAYLPIQDVKSSNDLTLHTIKKTVQYFPEGGPLVRKLLSRVAVRTQDEYGKPTAIQGKLMNSAGEVVTSFATNKHGLGEFEVEPQFGKDYFIEVAGQSDQIAISDIQDNGTVMRVDNSEASRITVLVQSNEPMMDAEEKEGLLVVYAQQTIFYAAACVLGTRRFVANFPKKDLPVNIAQVVLFSGKGEVLAKRNIVINQKRVQVSLDTDKPNYQPRDPVKVSLSITDGTINTLEGQFSVSIRKKYPNNVSTLSTISQHLDEHLLLGECMPDLTSAEEVDQWMIGTQLQHADWASILTNTFPKPDYLIQQGPLLRGQVWRNVRPEVGCKLDAFVAEHHYSYEITTDEEGKFDIPVVDYKEEATLFFVPDSTCAVASLAVVLDRHQGEEFRAANLSMTNEAKTFWHQQAIRLDASQDYRNIDEATAHPAQRFYYAADLTIRPEDYIPLPNMVEVFREIVAPVQVKGRPGSHRLRIVPDDEIVSFEETPLLLIDGWPTFEPKHLLSLAPEEVDRIEILNTYASYKRLGTIGRHGVISVFTRNGSFKAGRQKLIVESVPGVHQARSFHTPSYMSKESRKRTNPDFRATAYWNPSVKLNFTGKTELEFYLGDDLGTYEIDLQGLTKRGKPFSATQTFRVQ